MNISKGILDQLEPQTCDNARPKGGPIVEWDEPGVITFYKGGCLLKVGDRYSLLMPPLEKWEDKMDACILAGVKLMSLAPAGSTVNRLVSLVGMGRAQGADRDDSDISAEIVWFIESDNKAAGRQPMTDGEIAGMRLATLVSVFMGVYGDFPQIGRGSVVECGAILCAIRDRCDENVAELYRPGAYGEWVLEALDRLSRIGSTTKMVRQDPGLYLNSDITPGMALAKFEATRVAMGIGGSRDESCDCAHCKGRRTFEKLGEFLAWWGDNKDKLVGGAEDVRVEVVGEVSQPQIV